MKKFFTIATVLMLTMFVSNADAQVKFGLKGGLNVTKVSLDKNLVDASNRAGFFIGPTVKISLPLVGLSVDGSALYDQTSSKISAADIKTEETIKQQQIIVPLNLRYGIGLGSLANVFVFAGPQFGFNVGDKSKSLWNNVADWKLKESNFSVNVGAGVTLVSHLQATVNYNIACGSTGDVTFKDAATEAIKGKNRTWQVGLAYYF